MKKSKRHNEEAAAVEETVASPAVSATVTVRVKRQALNEGGFRAPGEVFETTPERRRALGSLVEDVS